MENNKVLQLIQLLAISISLDIHEKKDVLSKINGISEEKLIGLIEVFKEEQVQLSKFENIGYLKDELEQKRKYAKDEWMKFMYQLFPAPILTSKK